MKRSRRWIIAWSLALCAATGCSDGRQYRLVLDRAERQNQDYDSVTGIDSLRMAAAYYDRHGSPNERVRARYLLGCAFRDAGQPPRALEAWHEAADRADTTSEACDYGLLMRVHSQAAALFRQQLLPYEMLRELHAQHRCALRAGNDLAAINAVERMGDAYYLLDEPDSMIRHYRRASALYDQYGFHEEAAQALGPIITCLVERGDTAEARRCIARYETSTRFFRDGEPIPRKAFHYFSKGLYALAVGRTDSAEAYFRRLLLPGRDAQLREAGYRGMVRVYEERLADSRSLRDADSLARYADLYYRQTVPAEAAVNRDHLQQTEALYNHTRLQAEAQRAQARVRRQQAWLAVMALAMVVAALLTVGLLKRRQWERHRRRLEREALMSEQEKEEAIRQHQRRIDELERTLQTLMQSAPPNQRKAAAEGPTELPAPLATEEAMLLWRKVEEAGYVDADHQPTISRTQAALLADAMAECLGIPDKWKTFEALWHRKNMRSDYNDALNQRKSLLFQDHLKALITPP